MRKSLPVLQIDFYISTYKEREREQVKHVKQVKCAFFLSSAFFFYLSVRALNASEPYEFGRKSDVLGRAIDEADESPPPLPLFPFTITYLTM